MIVLMCIGILVSWQICQSDLANAGGKGHECSLAGTWMFELVYSESNPGAEENYDPSLVTFVPLDPTGKRFAMMPTVPEPILAGAVFPDAVRETNQIGTAVRVGKNLFKLSYYQYGINDDREKVWEIKGSSLTKFIDCDHIVTSISNYWYSDYWAELYPEWYSEGACWTGVSKGTRVEMFEPCSEYLPLPDEFPE
jgi:hypothetical protein